MVKHVVKVMGVLAALFGLRQFYRNWGTTKGECRSRLPGDDLVHAPAVQTTEGAWVDASADTVWAEVAQALRDRDRLARRLGVTLRAMDVSHGLSIVLRSTAGGLHEDATWSIRIFPHGDDRCRVLLRCRIALRHPGQVIGVELAGPVRALVTRGILLDVKRRAERDQLCQRSCTAGDENLLAVGDDRHLHRRTNDPVTPAMEAHSV
jgi:hypothetical protein